jgi:hypothetical protein|tara:strand:- start:245 stop:472 length:228 start_codon:yes stop_codon:yes gene_type:complete
MKAGDLLKHNGNHSLWLLVEVESEEKYSETLLVVGVKTGYRMWANQKAFEVVSKCQENVKSASNALQSDSERVTL